jgi:tetratricopeptide (TPR) repeat protein
MHSRIVPFHLAIVFLFASFIAGVSMARTAEDHPEVKSAFDKAWALQCLMHKDLKNLDKAAAIYRDVLSRYPDNPDALWKLSEVIFKKAYASKDKKQKMEFCGQSLALAEKAASKASNMAEPHYFIAVNCALLAETGGYTSKSLSLVTRAKKELNFIISINPKNRFRTLSKVVLANIYIDCPRPFCDLSSALDLEKQAVREDPNLTYASLILGKIYLKLGEMDSAKKELSRCLNTSKPTCLSDSVLFDWPEAKAAMKEIE